MPATAYWEWVAYYRLTEADAMPVTFKGKNDPMSVVLAMHRKMNGGI